MIFALLFQWGVAIQDLRVGRYFIGKMSGKALFRQAQAHLEQGRPPTGQGLCHLPLAGWPFFLPVFLGNLVANGIRNVWTYAIIFCGHFTDTVETFPAAC